MNKKYNWDKKETSDKNLLWENSTMGKSRYEKVPLWERYYDKMDYRKSDYEKSGGSW